MTKEFKIKGMRTLGRPRT